MSSSRGVVDEGRLTDLTRARAKSEAAEWAAMLEYAVRLEAEYNSAETTEFARQANIATIALEIGIATGLSEHQVHRRLTAAERVRGSAPQTLAGVQVRTHRRVAGHGDLRRDRQAEA